MRDELKPCPFCGSELIDYYGDGSKVYHKPNDCLLDHGKWWVDVFFTTKWNRRREELNMDKGMFEIMKQELSDIVGTREAGGDYSSHDLDEFAEVIIKCFERNGCEHHNLTRGTHLFIVDPDDITLREIIATIPDDRFIKEFDALKAENERLRKQLREVK
jgi:hypothetical protein